MKPASVWSVSRGDRQVCAVARRVAGGPPTKINDELDDLRTSHPLLPPDADAARALEVVPVHDHVDGKVEHDDNP
jgi:hypothetical protein